MLRPVGTHTNPLAYAVSLLMKGILTIYYHIFYYLMSHLYYLMRRQWLVPMIFSVQPYFRTVTLFVFSILTV